MSVRVGVNLLWLVPGDVGGSEEYTVGLLGALAELAPGDLDVTLFVNRAFTGAHADVADAFDTVVAPVSGHDRPRRVVAESTWLAARSRGFDAVHHAGGTLPFVTPVPTLITLHDLQPLVHPERFSLVKRTYIRTVVPASLRRARVVITLTAFTGDDVVARCGVDPSRLRLVPSGVSDARSLAPGAATEVLARYGLAGRRFLLYPAITYAHKNHETLVAAVRRLVDDRPDLILVLTGAAGPCEDQVAAAVRAHGLEDNVRRTGRVPADDLEVLYQRAAALAFPSSYEGFGLPVLEAMARGCPVVASRAAALPSVVDGGGLLVDTHDVPGWVDALASLLDDPGRATALAAAGRARAARFRWDTSARALAEAYRASAASVGATAPLPGSEDTR